MKTCPKCLSVFPDSVDFCMNDGSPLVNGTPKIRCNRCGALFPYLPNGQSAFCPSCGGQFTITQISQDNKQDRSQWTKGRIMAMVSIGIAFLATFLPFFTISVLGSKAVVSLWSENFVMTTVIEMIFLGLCSVAVFINSKARSKAIIFVGVVLIVDVIGNYLYNMNRLKNYHDDTLGGMDLSGMLSPGVGFYVLLICAITMIVSGVIMKQERGQY